MKLRVALFLVFLTSLLAAGNFIVQADWNSLNSGYAVTTDTHGEDVPLGTPVNATAGTTDEDVTTVEFNWIYNETVVWSVTKSVWTNGTTWNGDLIYYANDTQTPNILGEWGIQALFRGPDGHIRGEDIVRIRATSFTAVPEVPFGTLAVIIIMFVALGIFATKRKRNLPIKFPSHT